MKTLYLHIGTPKTGTSALQYFCAGNRKILEEKGIYVSSGSACSKGKTSPVLSALGVSDKNADSAVRVSFSLSNTKEDIKELALALNEGIKRFRR